MAAGATGQHHRATQQVNCPWGSRHSAPMTTVLPAASIVVAVLCVTMTPAGAPRPAPGQNDELRVFTNLDVAKVTSVLSRFRTDSTRLSFVQGDARELQPRLKERRVDVAIVEGVGYLDDAFAAGLLSRFESAAMRESIPFPLRGRGWYAVSYVVRGLAAAESQRASVKLTSVWAAPPVPGRMCLPPAAQLRSVAAVAGAQREFGGKAQEVVARWVSASRIQRSDADSLRAVVTGECSVALVHSDSAAARETAATTRMALAWPESKYGASILSTGAAMAARPENFERARQLLEWMATDGAQASWAAAMLSFPASQFVDPPAPVRALGRINADLATPQPTPAALIEAEKLAAAAGYR